MNIKKDRLEIARILKNNLPLMNKSKWMCQEIADCILVYLIEKYGDLSDKSKELLHDLLKENEKKTIYKK